MKTLARVIKPAGREWAWLGFTLLLALATLAAGLGLLSLSGWFITATALAGLAGAALDVFAPGAGIRAFAVTRTVARYAERLVAHETIFRQLARIRVRAFASLLRLDARRLHRMRRGDVLSRLTADVDVLDRVFLRLVSPTLSVWLLTALAAWLLAWFEPRLAWAGAGLLAAGGIVLLALIAAASRQPGQALARTTPALRARVTETLQGMAELKSLGQRRPALDEVGRAAGDQVRLQVRLRLIETAGQTALTVLGLIAAWLVLKLGLEAFEAGQMSAPVVMLAMLAMLALAEAWPPLAAGWAWLENCRRAADRVDALEQAGPEPSGSLAPDPEGALAFESVRFRYGPAADPVLDGASLEVGPGERVVVVGASGSGKSTLGLIAAGLVRPEAGRVSLGGREFDQLDAEGLRATVGYLPQKPTLFSDSLRANLALARPGADDGTLARALSMVVLDEFLDGLPEGLDTWIGEAGFNVSGGQARRLGLARLILADFPVLVLDEPTSGLDAATAAEMARRMAPWLAGRTVLMLSHDPDKLPAFDRMAEMRGGRLEALQEAL